VSVTLTGDDASATGGDRRVDQVAAQRSQARERSLLIGAGEPAEACDIGDPDRHELGLAHSSGSPALRTPSSKIGKAS
jgi:hypothetical protein